MPRGGIAAIRRKQRSRPWKRASGWLWPWTPKAGGWNACWSRPTSGSPSFGLRRPTRGLDRSASTRAPARRQSRFPDPDRPPGHGRVVVGVPAGVPTGVGVRRGMGIGLGLGPGLGLGLGLGRGVRTRARIRVPMPGRRRVPHRTIGQAPRRLRPRSTAGRAPRTPQICPMTRRIRRSRSPQDRENPRPQDGGAQKLPMIWPGRSTRWRMRAMIRSRLRGHWMSMWARSS